MAVGPWETIRDAIDEGRTEATKRQRRKPKAKPLAVTPAPGVRAKPTKKQIQVANAVTIPVKGNGGLDLRHARKDIPEGARYLDLARLFLGNYVRWPTPESLDLATLYVAMTHFVDDEGAPLFTAVPLWLLVGKHGSGKTQAMLAMRGLIREPTALAVRYTMPGIRDALHNHMVPFLDEAHRAFGGRTGNANQALQSIIVGAYKDGSGTLDGIGGLHEQTAFGTIVLAAQPQIMTNTNDALEDLFERSLIVTTEKSYEPVPPIDDNFRILADNFSNLLDIWAAAERPTPTNENKNPKLWPLHSMPDELTARAAEISAPLLAVADRAIDPDVAAQNGADVRWALIGREAVVKVLQGHGNNPSTVLGDIESRLASIGLDLGKKRQPSGTVKLN